MTAATATRTDGSFAPGSRVRVRDEEWIVRSTEPVGGGHFALSCIGVTELVQGYEAIFLTELEKPQAVRVDTTELVVDTSAGYRKSRLYIESLLRRSPPTDPALYIGHRAAMRRSNYQLRPAEDALKALRPRILIADGVGLGKTLEVGILLSELIVRGRGERILVVVMKSMLAQFQKELWTRFTIPLVRLDSEGIKRVRQKIPTGKNPFHYFKRAIISIDTLKNERQYRTWLEECRWDAVVIDECHNAVNVGTGRHKVASLLADTSDALILASATPHNGRPESFANLIRMLDPTSIADPHAYGPEDIHGLFRRRFKKDVEQEVLESFPQREPKLVWARANNEEEAVFEAISKATFRTLDRKVKLAAKGRPRDVLFKTTLLKSFLSGPHALLSTCQERIKRLDERIEAARGRGEVTTDLDQDKKTIVEIDSVAGNITSITKVETLFNDVLPELGILGKKSDPRIVIFSERLKTLEHLTSEFGHRFKMFPNSEAPDRAPIAVLTGAETDVKIQAVLEAFSASDGDVKVLLASDVASEGINLHHFCSRLIHFDVPWSLIRLEQRTGRIDRFGQKETPKVRYLLNESRLKDAHDDIHVVAKLIEKEQSAKKNIGDEGALMGLYDVDAEEEVTAAAISAKKDLDETIAEIRAEQGGKDAEPDAVDPWFLDQLLGNSNDTAEPPPNTGRRPSLFDDDHAFLRAALEEIAPAVKEAGGDLRLRFHAERPEVELSVPPDLARRFEQLPADARPRDGRLWLSTDYATIERAIEESRNRRGEWPDVQLLWPLHPAVAWAADRVLVEFGRQEAPVIVAHPMAAAGHDAIALFEGTLSNQNGQPVVVDWFGLPTKLGAAPIVGAALVAEEVFALTGLAKHAANPGKVATPIPDLGALRSRWEQAALDRMLKLRTDRGAQLGERLKDGLRRATSWENRSFEQLDLLADDVRRKIAGKLGLRAVRRIEDERKRVKLLKARRIEWLQRTFSTDERPYLRLVAVFVAR